MRILVYIFLSVVLGVLSGECKLLRVKLNEHGQFVDNFGRVQILHGFNSVRKGYPWYDSEMLNVTKLKLFKSWGFNVVRLGTMWSGVEPMENVYNETYLGVLKGIISQLDRFGMYSLLDMHQDVLSSKFETYDGVPLWLVNKFSKVPDIYKFPFPFPMNSNRSWPSNYITYAACDAFQNLYKSEIALGPWTRFWMKIAKTFFNETAVLGYELINEPWVGNFYENIELLTPGYAGKNNLLPVYDRLVKAIRQIDNETLVFYEPVTYGAYLPTTGDEGTGFDRVPGGDSQRSKSVLSYHYYCFFLNSYDASKSYPVWLRALCDSIFAAQLFKSAQKNIKVTGGGSMLTEFGLCLPDGNPESINTLECNAVLQLADEHLQSYTYWDSYCFDNDGNILPNAVDTFARTYPRAFQGQPRNYSFNRMSKVFELSFNIDLTINAPTEIFIPITVHYPRGFTNVTVPLMVTSFDNENFILSVYPTQNIKQNSLISVRIDPRN